jgi:Restriction endonuclease BglII
MNMIMPNHTLLPTQVTTKFEVFDWRNAAAILQAVHKTEFDEIVDVLSGFVLPRSSIEQGGGNKSPISKSLDGELYARGWIEKAFDTRIMVDKIEYESPTHSIDCFKGKVALEVEWNNKDPFFDRDLNNFRLLYELRVVDVGVIITRATSLERLLRASGRTITTYGKATTHTDKLIPKIKGGGAGGCPVLVFGIAAGAYRDDI